MVSDAFNRENKGQTVETVLRRMALTLQHPDDKNAYVKSCHGDVSNGMASLMDDKHDDVAIILFGRDDFVHHSILVRGDDVLVDSWQSRDGHGYDGQTKTYIAGRSGVLPKAIEISMDNFLERYCSDKLAFKSTRSISPTSP